MSSSTDLSIKPIDNWLHVITYKNKNERGRLFFARIVTEKVLYGYYIDSLMENPNLIVSHNNTLESLHIKNNNIAEVRKATPDEKKHVKDTIIEAEDISIGISDDSLEPYNVTAKVYIEALPV